MQQTTDDNPFAPDVAETGAAADIFALADQLRVRRDHKDALAEATKENNATIGKLEDTLAQRMIDEELPRFSRGGKTFHLHNELFVSTRKDMAIQVQAWLIDNGHADLVGKAVNAARLKSFVKEFLDEADDEELAVPEGLRELLNVFQKTTVRLRASN